MSDERTIEEMKEELQRQILQTALKSDNPQYKLDVFKAVHERAAKSKPAEPPPQADGMDAFRRRVKQAEESGNGAI